MFDHPKTVLLAGAGGGLGKAIAAEIAQCFPDTTLLTFSRGEINREAFSTVQHRHFVVDLETPECVAAVREFLETEEALPDWAINCCGILHDESHGPEKALDQCRDDWLLESMRVNLLTHLHLAQALGPLLKPRHALLWASLSAKVGSIEDNQLGGWYSYRMSKAALNMLVKNLSIEWGRRLDNSCVVAVHPGTTDTALSKPFQKNIAAGKLYSPQLSAQRIVGVLRNLTGADSGQLLFWDGSVIPW